MKDRTHGQSFMTPRKDKKQGEGRREVSPSPLGRKGIKPPGLSLPSVSEYEDEGLDDAFGSMWDLDARNPEDPPERVTSWRAGQLGKKSSYEETGEEARDLGLSEGKGIKLERFMGPSGLLPTSSGKPPPIRPASRRQRRLHEEEIARLEREGTLSREEEAAHKEKEDSWDYDS